MPQSDPPPETNYGTRSRVAPQPSPAITNAFRNIRVPCLLSQRRVFARHPFCNIVSSRMFHKQKKSHKKMCTKKLSSPKNLNFTKIKKLKCDKTQKLQFLQNSKTQNGTTHKNSKCDKKKECDKRVIPYKSTEKNMTIFFLDF